MFSALLKAFTGRAGFLASLLVLILIALVAAAVLQNLPRIEQNLQTSAQQVLGETMVEGDELRRLEVEGRDLMLEGQFQDPAGLASRLAEIEGVRRVVINGGEGELAKLESVPIAPWTPAEVEGTGESAVAGNNDGSATTTPLAKAGNEPVQVPQPPTENAGSEPEVNQSMVAEGGTGSEVNQPTAAEEGAETQLAQPPGATELEVAVVDSMSGAEQPQTEEQDTGTAETAGEQQNAPESTDADKQSVTQSILSLRYDGTRLRLTGHLQDAQMAQLIGEKVESAAPAFAEIEIDVDGKGTFSPLDWMNEFLKAISRLPDDAQGVIVASDEFGVRIIPDAEQTLRQRVADAAQGESGSLPEDQSASEQPQADEQTPSEQNLAPAADTSAENISDAPIADEESVARPVVNGEDEHASRAASEHLDPQRYIDDFNRRISEHPVFESGRFEITDALRVELDDLARLMEENPNLLLKVVGNIDFSSKPRVAAYVGYRRAREVRDYLYSRGVEPYRVYISRLPSGRAFSRQVQVVFYISE